MSWNFVTGTSTPQRILSRLVDQREDLDSTVFALQSSWLKDHGVTVFGFLRSPDLPLAINFKIGPNPTSSLRRP